MPAIDAARRLKRRWVGIDISAFAIDLVRDRRLRDPTILTVGIPADLEGARKLAAEQPFAFESWAVTRLPGFAPNTQQRGDGGIDGRATLALPPDDLDSRLALAQVKGGKFSVSYLRDFRHVIDREQAAVGCFVTLDPPPPKDRGDVKTAGQVHVAGQPYDRLHLCWTAAEPAERVGPAAIRFRRARSASSGSWACRRVRGARWRNAARSAGRQSVRRCAGRGR